MLESAGIGHRVSKQVYAREEPKLREALLNAQYDLAQSNRGPGLLIISGVEARGIAAEDWRNREQWNAYDQAACDMVDRTSTRIAPWTRVEAEDEYFAPVKVAQTIAERLQRALAQ